MYFTKSASIYFAWPVAQQSNLFLSVWPVYHASNMAASYKKPRFRDIKYRTRRYKLMDPPPFLYYHFRSYFKFDAELALNFCNLSFPFHKDYNVFMLNSVQLGSWRKEKKYTPFIKVSMFSLLWMKFGLSFLQFVFTFP